MKNFWRLWNKVIITTRRELPLIPSYQKLWKPENGTKARLPKVPLGSATVGIKTPKYADEKNKWNLCVLKIGTGVTQIQNPERYSIQISDTHLFLSAVGIHLLSTCQSRGLPIGNRLTYKIPHFARTNADLWEPFCQ